MQIANSGLDRLDELKHMGMALRAAGDFEQAAAVFAEIADLTPGDWLARYNAGAVALEAGKIERSAALLERALSLGAGEDVRDLVMQALALEPTVAPAT